MKKYLLMLLIILCLFVTACGNNSNGDSTNKKKDSVTLQADNEYYIISGLDYSECKYEDNYYSGYVYFNSHTTEKYVETYKEYFYRKIYFEIIDITGETVGTDTTFDNYIYDEEYTSQGSAYINIRSKNPIKEVKINKIELLKN